MTEPLILDCLNVLYNILFTIEILYSEYSYSEACNSLTYRQKEAHLVK